MQTHISLGDLHAHLAVNEVFTGRMGMATPLLCQVCLVFIDAFRVIITLVVWESADIVISFHCE